MSRNEWKQLNQANTNHELSDFAGVEGESLHVVDSSTNSIEALKKSLSDTPVEGKIETQTKGPTTCFYFRIKDGSNHYVTTLNIDTGRVNLYCVTDGQIESFPSTGQSDLSLDEYFHPHRMVFWVDSRGDLRVRWFIKYELNSESDPDWWQIGTDLVDRDPTFSSGGGIGLGGFTECEGNNMTWHDETKIYYPD